MNDTLQLNCFDRMNKILGLFIYITINKNYKLQHRKNKIKGILWKFAEPKQNYRYTYQAH